MLFSFFLISSLVIIIDITCFFLFQKKNQSVALDNLPTISILVAVRNEEKNILACLESLNNLNYPHHKLQILIGNDLSTDKTVEIVENFICDKPKFQLIHISENIGNAVGKANVLAQLAHQATGEWLFFTDADICQQPNWLLNMLEIGRDKDLITGFTWIKDNALQAIEWSFTLGVAKIFSDFNLYTTAMGNNMAIKKEMYLKTGGYEKLSPSIVEDFSLLQAVIKQKGSFINIVEQDVKAYSMPTDTFLGLLHQRKRWMKGAIKAPWYAKMYILIRLMFILSLLCAFFTNPEQWQTILGIWITKMVFQSILILSFINKIKEKIIWMYIIVYELYTNLLILVLIIYYLLPFQVFWKGRKYT
ncbi:MAG: glycosyltransferase [Raineya sp.]|jgi:cellulose synthase/poly-beta-1,6-N-acetylglucosamine synthase-like glycosyltransferase|nr:glycosyltransferase [Raineya sp.]